MIKDMKNLGIMGLALAVLILAAGCANPAAPEQGTNTQGSSYSDYAPSQGSGTAPSAGVRYATASAGSAGSGSGYWPGSEQPRLISSSGTVTKAYSPDEAKLWFTVQTLDKSASKSQQMNAETSAKVRDALKAAGVADADIQTSSYTLYEDYQWNSVTQKSESIGYRTQNSIEVTVRDFALTGSVIDAAVKAGVNSVGNIQFQLSKTKEAAVRAELLTQAAAMAKTKAERLAAGFDTKIARLYSASEGYSYYPVYNNYAYASKDMMAGEAAPTTPISPQDVDVTVTVNAEFELE